MLETDIPDSTTFEAMTSWATRAMCEIPCLARPGDVHFRLPGHGDESGVAALAVRFHGEGKAKLGSRDLGTGFSTSARPMAGWQIAWGFDGIWGEKVSREIT